MFYRPLQFFTLLQAYAAGFSILRYINDFFPSAAVVVVPIVVFVTVGGWLYWYFQTGKMIQIKIMMMGILIGMLLGIFL